MEPVAGSSLLKSVADVDVGQVNGTEGVDLISPAEMRAERRQSVQRVGIEKRPSRTQSDIGTVPITNELL